MYVGSINNKMYEMRENKIMTTFKVPGIDSSKLSQLETVSEPSFVPSKAAKDIMKFCEEFNDSPIVQDIKNTCSEQCEIKLKYEIQKSYEEQGLDCPDDTEYNYDETKYKFYAQMSEDIGTMVGAAIEYYNKNGSFDGMTSEDISKETKSIEYKDLELLVELKEEIGRIDKEEFATEAEYYDALIEKIDKSDLSDKAKQSIGGYLHHLKIESQKVPEVEDKNKLSPQEIEKKLASIKEEMEREKREAEERKEIHRKEVLKLNKELTKMYMNKYI